MTPDAGTRVDGKTASPGTQNEVLATFFQSLLNKKSGTPAGKGQPASAKKEANPESDPKPDV